MFSSCFTHVVKLMTNSDEKEDLVHIETCQQRSVQEGQYNSRWDCVLEMSGRTFSQACEIEDSRMLTQAHNRSPSLRRSWSDWE